MHAGRGAYGTVYKAQDTSSNEVVAIKIISLTENDLDDLKQIQKEIEYLADCNHPNIVKYLVSLQRHALPEGVSHAAAVDPARQLLSTRCQCWRLRVLHQETQQTTLQLLASSPHTVTAPAPLQLLAVLHNCWLCSTACTCKLCTH